MHYGLKTFSRNGLATLRPLKDGGSQMGQRRGFSHLDILKLNKLYNCPIDGSSNSVEVSPCCFASKKLEEPQLKFVNVHVQLSDMMMCVYVHACINVFAVYVLVFVMRLCMCFCGF